MFFHPATKPSWNTAITARLMICRIIYPTYACFCRRVPTRQPAPVSYTHLDVYKRQKLYSPIYIPKYAYFNFIYAALEVSASCEVESSEETGFSDELPPDDGVPDEVSGGAAEEEPISLDGV